MPHRTSPIGTDIQDGGYGLPRIPLLGSRVNKAIRRTGASRPHPPSLSRRAPACARGASSLVLSLVVCLLPDAYNLLDLLRQRLLLLGPLPVVLLLPVAGFLLHQSALCDPARLYLEVAVLLRVAHRRSPPSVHKRRLPWPLTNAYPMVWEAKQEDP